MTLSIPFDNSYARLPDGFFAHVAPFPSPAPRLIRLNTALATDLGLDPQALGGPQGLDILSGRTLAPGSQPIAMAYAGHQFGNFVPQLGDGRAILLGEIVDPRGRRHDLQLKGGGRTPWSRMGDGKAALDPVLREYVVSEAMAALGIPTTRALAAVLTGEPVFRETALPGAIVARVASSHIRCGTFQYFAARGDIDALRTLADHVIARHYPHAADTAAPYHALLDAVIAAQADLVSAWMLVGFIHGVMNTDNMSIAGETIDYGPCAFLDSYDPATVFSSIDRQGRYAYGNQPAIAHWNLTRFAETLLPLLSDDADAAVQQARTALTAFAPRFESRFNTGLAAKIGLAEAVEGDTDLIAGLLSAMTAHQVDFTLFFRRLADVMAGAGDAVVRDLFVDPTACDAWLAKWRARLTLDLRDAGTRAATMRRANPAIIPRNHRIEQMITAAVERDDYAPFDALMRALAMPYEDRPEFAYLQEPPSAEERVRATFCGT